MHSQNNAGAGLQANFHTQNIPAFAMAAKMYIEEPKWEKTEEQTDEEAFRDYTEELTNWVFTMEDSQWVLEINDAA